MKAAQMAPPKTPGATRGTVHDSTTHGVVKFTIRAAPMPPALLNFLQDNLLVLRRLLSDRKRHEEGVVDVSAIDELDNVDGFDIYGDVIRKPTTRVENFWTALESVVKTLPPDLANLADKIWAFGPHSAGGCVLIDAREGGPYSRRVILPCLNGIFDH